MNKNLLPKFILIIVLAVGAAWTLYPPEKTLKGGLDLVGGTSLIYEIDTHGLEPEETKGLSGNMITILRRRIDPANIQNLVWRPQGNTRFEIQMPLATDEDRQNRLAYDNAMLELLDKNISPAIIMRSLSKPQDERERDFEKFAQGLADRLRILNELATAYDQRKELRDKSQSLLEILKSTEESFASAGIDVNDVKQQRSGWSKLNEAQLVDTLKEFLATDSTEEIDNLTKYVQTYSEWADVTDELTVPEIGKNDQYKAAQKELDNLNLTEDQIMAVLSLPAKSTKRAEAIKALKRDFNDRKEAIDKLVAVYNPKGGRLDDPRDLQRMLKGAGILEFRILPTIGDPEVDAVEMAEKVELLRTKGPRYASDKDYVWCEIEKFDEWQVQKSIVGDFGDKYYVLASNKKNQTMLHDSDKKQWKLKNSRPTQDQDGRRAIAFSLDIRGGDLFANVTGNNMNKPLCILLDGMAISAPNIQARIYTDGIITGSFTQTEVADMVNKLNAGSLPARLIEQPISVKTIGPSIGADNCKKGINAGLIGLVVVIICMAVYYLLAGAVADLALLMNILLILAVMALVRATFTLPGIAGLILTIGMSVDANVLIFERIREEQKKGSSLRIAIKNGYQKAFRTIMDANLTTFIVAAILYWRASEEVKGFAVVLMLGIASSMFTALFVTRTIFDYFLTKRVIKDHLVMLRLFHQPNINWMKLRPVFLTISFLLIVSGLYIFLTRDDTNNKYDIEFTGGTSIQIDLKNPSTRQEAEDKFKSAAESLGNRALMAANIYSIGKSGKQFEINTTETNKITADITFGTGHTQTVDSIASAVGDKLSDFVVTQKAGAFVITTSQTNKSIVTEVLTEAFGEADISEPRVDEVVNQAILKAFEGELKIQENLQPQIASQEKVTEQLIESYPELADFMGGIKITCNIEKQVTGKELAKRFKDLPFKPDLQNLTRYPYQILDLNFNNIADSDKPAKSFIYLSVDPEAGFREFEEEEWQGFVKNETTKVMAATTIETSLPRVTQINPSVGEEAKTQAKVAIVLSLFAIVVYIWIRFGTARYGFAAIAALVHDVCITLGAVTACTYIASRTIGEFLLIGDFKITLAIIAAFLTLIGYSLNDTIVVFDRIRENRGKGQLRPQIINDSINQTLSRTILTSFTTFIVVLIMYIFGGDALRGFTFAIGLGIIIGTYSSVAIAAPILLVGSGSNSKKNKGLKQFK